MNINVGTLDRVFRVAVGLLLVAIALGYMPGYQTVWAWVGLVPLLSGVFGTCPVYAALGINTCKMS